MAHGSGKVVNMRYLADVRDTGTEAAFVNIVAQHAEVERYHVTLEVEGIATIHDSRKG